MQLVVLTPDTDLPGEQETVNSLFHMGLQRLHLRKPAYDIAAYRAYIAGIDSAYHSRIIIHGAYPLYHALRLGGIHLRSAIRHEPATLQQIKDIPYSAISTSFHSWDEILQNHTPYGNVFISPLYDSISKAGYSAAVAPEGISGVKESLANGGRYCPAITGLGGIDRSNIPTLQRLRYDGAAVLGALWQSKDPIAIFAALQAIIK
ncbi:thiamine phosphate synthase [Nemorincola caseinilytica]|uniref:Thiamine phosphate synthase n=1 Tax=Nemorincola caseinilytica TaxID=2054315 RepID=A0ABP8NJ13_9BACT